MKKIIFNLSAIIFLSLTILVVIMTTIGIETDKFNNIISKKINIVNKNINLTLRSIKFKLDVKDISLFLETTNPQINYRNIDIPTRNIKLYVNFLSLVKSNPQISKIKISLEELDVNQVKKISKNIKPSNFKSLINNKVKRGKLISEFEIYLNENNLLENFITRGSVSDLQIEITKDFYLEKTNFNFFGDKTDVLLKNIFGKANSIKITDGDLKIKLSPDILLESNFITNLKYDKNLSTNYNDLLKNFEYFKDITKLEANLNNSLLVTFDKTYKLKRYNFRSNGKIKNANFNFKKQFVDNFSNIKINQLSLINTEIKTNFSSKKNDTTISGKYSLNNGNLLAINLKNVINKDKSNLKLNIEYNKDINLDLINYQKTKGSIANISINLEKQKKKIEIKKIDFTENKNSILVENLKFKNNKFLSLGKIIVNTEKNEKKNNDFSLLFGKKISIKGSHFDASNLPKILNKKKTSNILSKISKSVEIDFTNIAAPLSENLKNFKLIGEIEKGKFTKISSKGDYGNNNFLDINLKNDKKSKKKYLEIFSDLPRTLLTEYKFFRGLTGGKLLFTSVIDNEISNSKLKIENFKVINAPGMVKLLSIADLGGLADLAEGEGLSFDILEINLEKNNDILKFNEILALGPSVSVLMEGYQDKNGLTSLRGTLVPAKTLNKMISKIPVLGKIIIPKEVGEGLFGISFKMKGPSDKIKTTINPIKTLTPRFIQKILEKNKSSK